MNAKSTLAVFALSCFFVFPAAHCAEADRVVAWTLLSDGSTNTWTQADLIAALQLVNRKYHRDVATSSGRKAWHGALVSSVADAEAFTVTETYEDGAVFVDSPPVRTAADDVAAANAKLKTTLVKGVPARLAAARLERAVEKSTTNTVTVVVSP